ncbi:MAG: thiamine-phosphate kinase [Spirochaetales bacterium]|nr:thiamine-phosphate kinase [Spirochaetales bacterium]
MKINEIGGEFALINLITKSYDSHPGIICGIGDDCAVIRSGRDTCSLITTDMMVENDHFSLKWFTPEQIGKKCMESNVSDIIAMGGKPEYAFVSICLKKDTDVEFIKGFYKGLYESAERHNVLLLGGDTTHGTEYVFNLALTGTVPSSLLKLRSMARVGDFIAVTGTLGGSTAGLKLLLNNRDGYFLDHLEPRSRTQEEGAVIARYAHAMIDVSDGLGSEVFHICQKSNTGAEIDLEAIPLSEHTVRSAETLGSDPYEYALYGGEDFELVFTIPEHAIKELTREFDDFTIVGRIVEQSEDIHIISQGEKTPVKKGYDHFA